MQVREKQAELLDCEASRLSYSLGPTFHRDQTDWVYLHRYGLFPHGEIPKGAKNPANVTTAFGCEKMATPTLTERNPPLWKDWPQPVTTGHSKNVFLQAISIPEENWHLVPGDYQATGIMAADLHGNIVFRDAATDKTWKIGSDEQVSAYSKTRRPY